MSRDACFLLAAFGIFMAIKGFGEIEADRRESARHAVEWRWTKAQMADIMARGQAPGDTAKQHEIWRLMKAEADYPLWVASGRDYMNMRWLALDPSGSLTRKR